VRARVGATAAARQAIGRRSAAIEPEIGAGHERKGDFVRRIMAVFAAATMLAACIPVTTRTPVGTTVGLGSDPGLYGMWEGWAKDGKDTAFIAIVPGTEGDTTAILMDMTVPAKSGDWTVYTVTTATLGGYRYMNARAKFADGGQAKGRAAENSFPIFYRVAADGTLTLALLDEDAAKAAVKSGKIAGKIEGGNFGDVTLTAPPASLDAFFASDRGRALFARPLIVLQRVK